MQTGPKFFVSTELDTIHHPESETQEKEKARVQTGVETHNLLIPSPVCLNHSIIHRLGQNLCQLQVWLVL